MAHLWSGWYKQGGKEVKMAFDSVYITKGKVAGVGRDQGHRFRLKGKRSDGTV